LKHWWQLRGIVKTRRLNWHISGKWDEAWKMFACEELEIKKIKEEIGRDWSRTCCLHLRMCLV
jgi:hypothetical protein